MKIHDLDTSNHTLEPFVCYVEKPWGFELILTPQDSPVTGKILHVNAGKRLSLQYHDEKIESLTLISGEAKLTLSDAEGVVHEIDMVPRKGYFVRPGQIHRVTAVTDMEFIESSTPETGNTYRLEDDNKRPTETEEDRKKNRGWM